MGVKFGRQYKDIIDDFSAALGQIDDLYSCFEMSAEDWNGMEDAERSDCIRTLADDLFYGLGTEGMLQVGSGTVTHDAERHILKVNADPDLVTVVYLV
jgi:hypothetical protein